MATITTAPVASLSFSSTSTSNQTVITISASDFGSLYGYSLAFLNLPSGATVSLKNNITNWTPSVVNQNSSISLVAADFSLSNPTDTSTKTTLATLTINQGNVTNLLELSNISLTVKSTTGAFTDANLNTTNYNISITGGSNFAIHDSKSSNTYTATSGTETLLYTDLSSNYTITKQLNSISITNINNGVTDTLNGFSRIKFSDIGFAYDLNSNAGQVAKIIGAVFGSASITNSSFVGIGLKLFDQGNTYQDVLNIALNFKLGSGYSNEAEIGLLYKNLVNIQPSALEIASWVNQIQNKTYTQVSLAQFASDSSFNTTNIGLTGLVQTGIIYS